MKIKASVFLSKEQWRDCESSIATILIKNNTRFLQLLFLHMLNTMKNIHRFIIDVLDLK